MSTKTPDRCTAYDHETDEEFSAGMAAAIERAVKAEARIRALLEEWEQGCVVVESDNEEPPPEEVDTFNDSRWW